MIIKTIIIEANIINSNSIIFMGEKNASRPFPTNLTFFVCVCARAHTPAKYGATKVTHVKKKKFILLSIIL